MIENKFIFDEIDKIKPFLITTRRYLHSNPELSFKEINTMNYICSILDEIGVKYTSEIAGTGVVAIINGKKHAEHPKTILIRADIDALPIYEASNNDYSSKNKGVMHACGHDAHTAILMGVCHILNKFSDKLNGNIKLLFQPGEETTGGAKPMIDAGVLSNPDVDICLALHVDPDIETGKIRIKPGSLYASPDDFKIVVKGKGGHGAEPHNCIDPINISAQIISSLMSLVSREISPFDEAVVSVGSVHSGTATNIIPDCAVIEGTARSLTNETRFKLKKRIGEIANCICGAYGASCDYNYNELFPPLINDEKLSQELYKVAVDLLGTENCIFGGNATMAGEDFSYFCQEKPSVIFKLGSRNEKNGITTPLHHSSFDIDENCMSYGVALFVAFVFEYLSRN